MRFRVLSDTELKTLEEDLIQFLVVNHVYGDDWAKMNTENPSQAQKLIALFSDLVLEKVYNKVDFLERKLPKQISICKLDALRGDMLTIESQDPSIDLRLPADYAALAAMNPSPIEVFKGEKQWKQDKADEVFLLLNHGFSPTTSNEWDEILNLLIN
jgi:hypothetical protein